jgi:hypothetical protein
MGFEGGRSINDDWSEGEFLLIKNNDTTRISALYTEFLINKKLSLCNNIYLNSIFIALHVSARFGHHQVHLLKSFTLHIYIKILRFNRCAIKLKSTVLGQLSVVNNSFCLLCTWYMCTSTCVYSYHWLIRLYLRFRVLCGCTVCVVLLSLLSW